MGYVKSKLYPKVNIEEIITESGKKIFAFSRDRTAVGIIEMMEVM